MMPSRLSARLHKNSGRQGIISISDQLSPVVNDFPADSHHPCLHAEINPANGKGGRRRNPR